MPGSKGDIGEPGLDARCSDIGKGGIQINEKKYILTNFLFLVVKGDRGLPGMPGMPGPTGPPGIGIKGLS